MVRFLITQCALAAIFGSMFLGALYVADPLGLASMIERSPDRLTVIAAGWTLAMGPLMASFIATAMALRCWER